ncbi:hypothetical protein Tco_1217989 [Tanacetum coccineum]
MNPVVTQQVALDNALVAPAKRLKIKRCNARIEFNKPQKEETYQVTLDALKLSPCYPAFQITLDKKKCRVDTEVFREILQICPRLPNQEFVDPPSEDELVLFIKELGYSGRCEMCISGKTIGLDRLRESRAQILWGMYNQKNVDYVALLWEDFMYQADNREISSARKEHMPYPRFTKFVSKTDDCQKFGAQILEWMINEDIKRSKAYKTYLDYATGKVPPKKARKFKKVASPSKKSSPVLEEEPVKKSKRFKRSAKKSTTTSRASVEIRDTPGLSTSKKKEPAKHDKGKGIDLLYDVALFEAAQLKKAIKKSKQDTHKLHASGSSQGADFELEVPDDPTGKSKDTSEGTGVKPKVLDVSNTNSSDSDDESWGKSKDERNDVNDEDDNDDSGNNGCGGNDVHDSERTDLDDDENPSLL